MSEITLLGEDTGSIVHLSFTGGARPALRRTVVFLSTGETVCIDPSSASTGGSPRLRTWRSDARRWEIHMSGSAALSESPVRFGDGDTFQRRSVPVGITATVEGLDTEPWPHGAPESALPRATAVKFSGSITVGSLIYTDDGLGWAVSAAGEPASMSSRLLGAFQDGTAVFAEGSAITSAEDSAAVVLAGSKSEHGSVHRLHVDRSGPGPVLACTIGSSSPADVTGEVRHIEQRVDHVHADPDGEGRLSSSMFPFVLVRTGITGIGLVEHVAATGWLPTNTAHENVLPDPY